jgi:hypothetical protein
MGTARGRLTGRVDGCVITLTALAGRDSIAGSERMAGMAGETTIPWKSRDL